MTGGKRDPHPAPRRARVATWQPLVGIVGAPRLWAAQLTAGSAYGADACFERGHRLVGGATAAAPAIIVSGVALLGALTAAFLSWRLVRRTRGENGEDSEVVLDTGHGRTHFMARWAIILSLGFALAILVNLVAMLGTPPCG